MNIFVYGMIGIIFFYSVGFSVSLWKEKNKIGASVVFILALVVIVAPFFTVL